MNTAPTKSDQAGVGAATMLKQGENIRRGVVIMRKNAIFLAALLTLVAFGTRPAVIPPAYAACEPGERIDKSTADDARKKLMTAGYSNVHDLKKGCDNVWHAIATHNGKEGRVALEPSGKIYPEGD